MPRIKLTPEIAARILAGIRSGGYPLVAAMAAGVPAALFRQWLRKGELKARRPYRQFWLQVCQARAQARLMAEVAAHELTVFWLRFGPGKHAWHTRPKSSQSGHVDEALFAQLLGELATLLGPHPEVRETIVKLLTRAADSADAPRHIRGLSRDGKHLPPERN